MAGETPKISLQAGMRRDNFRIIARLQGELRNRTTHMMEMNDTFGFLPKMDSTKDEDIDSAIKQLSHTYVGIVADGMNGEDRRV